MKDNFGINICHLEGEVDLSDDIPLYRYLSTEAFLYLLNFKRITFTKITDWPDRYEGSRFSFLKKTNKFENNEEIKPSDFYASCWSLQEEERSLYQSEADHSEALKELSRNGSAAMWESYCKNGGVRIRTTLGKIKKALSNSELYGEIYRGRAYYEPEGSWTKSINTVGLVSTLLHKRISFRYESEYRFLIKIKDNPGSIVYCGIDSLYDFIDEILVSPATPSTKWVARTLYHEGVTLSLQNENHCINNKNSKQFCRISQLYSLVSETIGHYDMA